MAIFGFGNAQPSRSEPLMALQAAANARLQKVATRVADEREEARAEAEFQRTGVRPVRPDRASQAKARSDWEAAIRLREEDQRKFYAEALNQLYPIGGDLFTPITSPAGLGRLRNLDVIEQDNQIRLCKWFYQYNPIANRSVNIVPEYVIGDGISFASMNDEVHQVLSRHWDNPDNNWFVRQFDRARELGLSGELVMTADVNRQNGEVTLGTIVPEVIYEVATDPINADKVHAVVMRQIGNDDTTRFRTYKVIGIDGGVSPDSEVYGMRIGLPKDEQEAMEWGVSYWKGKEEDLAIPITSSLYSQERKMIPIVWDGSCFFTKVNSPLGATRGWSDLFSDYIWLDAHDQLLAALVQRAINSGKYLTDIELTGFGQAQIDEWVAKNHAVNYAGQEVVHNENVKYSFPSPDLRLEDSSNLTTTLKNHVLSGVGLPPIWFSESLTARASAPEMTEPSFKHLKVRQREYADLLSEVFRFCIDQAVLSGYIAKDVAQGKSFYLKLPDVSQKDQRVIAIAVKSFAEALVKMVEIGYPRVEANRLFNRYLDQLGLDTQLDEPMSSDVGGNPMLNVDRILQDNGITDEQGNVIRQTAESLDTASRHAIKEESGAPLTRGGSSYYIFGENKDVLRRAIAPVAVVEPEEPDDE